MVWQPVLDGRGDDRVAEQFAPLAELLVGSQDDDAPFVPGGHQGEEGGGRLPVVGPDAELVHDQHLGRQVDRYYLSNAPEDTTLETLAYVGGSRWCIETEFETEKGDVGLDEYETRSWAGWHHHIAMCLLGGAFLLSSQQDWGGKMPRITRPQSLPSCKRGCTGWCVRCCHGRGSGQTSCCYG